MAQPTQYQRVGTTQHDVTEAGVASVGYLYFDGVNDAMATSTITPGIDKVQVFAGVRRTAVTSSYQCLFETSASTDSNNGVVAIFSENAAAGGRIYSQSKGTVAVQAYPSAGVFPNVTTSVVTGLGDISGDTITLRKDGTQVAQAASEQGTGNYLAYPLYIGARGGTALPANMNLYSLITRFGATLDAPTIASTETWVAGKTGISIP